MSRRGVMIGLLAGTAVLGVGGCGGSYRSEAPGRAPETCSGSDALPHCAERLERYERELRDMLPGLPLNTPSMSQEAAPPRLTGSPGEPYLSEQASAPADEEAEPSSEPRGPDCSAARDLRDRICELADAICGLAAQPDAAEQTVNTCTSATASCTRARDQVGAACPE